MLSALSIVRAQLGEGIFVQGKNIIGPCGDTLLLKGVNYAPYNWGWSPSDLRINQIGLSGSNCVRIVWYKNGSSGTPASTYSNITLLDSVLSKCIQNKLIPIIELHDQTCQNSSSGLINLSSWFTQNSIKPILLKYKHSIILNIANEALYVNWTSNPTTSLNTFISTYNSIITNLRNNGLNMPVMIDAPDCGTNIEALANASNALLTNDIKQNLIFSAHAYWYGYANNDSLTFLNKINYMLSKNVAFLFGEIANYQDDATLCQYSLNLSALLNICKTKKLGWIAWSWDNDGCTARQLTTNGNFNSLSPYGNYIFNNSNIGINSNPPSKSMYLEKGACVLRGKCFVQGYYLSSNQNMRPVVYNQGATSNQNLCEQITVKLSDAIAPYPSTFSVSTFLHTNGLFEFLTPLSQMGQSKYVTIQTHNGIETWSAFPQLMRSTLFYDFSTSAAYAYGNNLVPIDLGKFGIYSGDIDQNGYLELDDYNLWNIEYQTGFPHSDYTPDLDGNGYVELDDYNIWDMNYQDGVFSMRP